LSFKSLGETNTVNKKKLTGEKAKEFLRTVATQVQNLMIKQHKFTMFALTEVCKSFVGTLRTTLNLKRNQQESGVWRVLGYKLGTSANHAYNVLAWSTEAYTCHGPVRYVQQDDEQPTMAVVELSSRNGSIRSFVSAVHLVPPTSANSACASVVNMLKRAIGDNCSLLLLGDLNFQQSKKLCEGRAARLAIGADDKSNPFTGEFTSKDVNALGGWALGAIQGVESWSMLCCFNRSDNAYVEMANKCPDHPYPVGICFSDLEDPPSSGWINTEGHTSVLIYPPILTNIQSVIRGVEKRYVIHLNTKPQLAVYPTRRSGIPKMRILRMMRGPRGSILSR